MPQSASDRLRSLLLGSGSANDPLELAALRGSRQRELEERLVNEASTGDQRAASRSAGLLRLLGMDQADDPDTGDAAHDRVARTQTINDDLSTYTRPDVTARREDQRGYEIDKATAPARIAGSTARDVARITGEAHVLGAQAAARGRAGGAGTRGKLSPVLAEKAAGADTSLDTLRQLRQEFDPALIGPAMGRIHALAQALPGLPVNGKFASFSAKSSILQNSVIKAITGAQMSEPEAARISRQVPLPTDKPDVWKEKAAATESNLRFLSRRVRELAGALGDEDTDPTDDDDLVTDPNWGR